MCVDLPDCIRKQSSRLRSPIPSPTLMKIRVAWHTPSPSLMRRRFAWRFGPNHSPTAPVGAMSDAE